MALPQNAARLNLLADSLLSGVTAAIIWRGHESPVAGQAIWSLPPLLLVIAILSATAIGVAQADIAAPRQSGPENRALVLGRPIIALLLLVVLGLASAT